ncbi:MAG: SdpI family protein [bacterium]|nr:SdpI family protein [bacterium]
MRIHKSELIVWGILLLAVLLGICSYPRIPATMASHWNARGEVDGYMPKFWGLFLIPFILAVLDLFFLAIPKIDPRKANIEKFRKYYDGFIIVFSLFMLAVHAQVILWNLGTKISPNLVLPVGMGLLFFYIGVLFRNAKQNWFIGIRTPWTLDSEKVWDRTHRLGGTLFKFAGVAAFTGVFFRRYAVLFILIPVLFSALCTVVYSYFAYRKEMKQGY